jgi:hypothetical protein
MTPATATVAPPSTRRAQARGARDIAEAALDRAGWPWRRRLSSWLDALVALEERES